MCLELKTPHSGEILINCYISQANNLFHKKQPIRKDRTYLHNA